MTCEEFTHIQDSILELSGRELAAKLKAPASSVSQWRKPIEAGGREIPDYIAELLGYLVREKLGTLTIPLTIDDINGIIRLAAARGLSFDGLLVSLIRTAIKQDTLHHYTQGIPVPTPIIHRDIKPASITYQPSEEQTKAARLNEAPLPPPPKPRA